MASERTRNPSMGRQELPTSADAEFENCEQEEDGVSTDQTSQTSRKKKKSMADS
jgi:hypothetical protein